MGSSRLCRCSGVARTPNLQMVYTHMCTYYVLYIVFVLLDVLVCGCWVVLESQRKRDSQTCNAMPGLFCACFPGELYDSHSREYHRCHRRRGACMYVYIIVYNVIKTS